MQVRKQTQIVLDVILILDDKDKDSKEVAYDRLATALYSLDDHMFDIRNIHKTSNIQPNID